MKSRSLNPKQSRLLILFNLLLMALLAHLFLFSPGTTDVDEFWMRWMHNIESGGMRHAYVVLKTDYPPLFFMLFRLADRLRAIFHLGLSDFQLIKVCLVILFGLFLVISSAIFHIYTSRKIYHAVNYTIVNLVIWHNAICLGYFDVLNLIFLGIAFFFYRKEKMYSCLLFLLFSLLFKWQPLVLIVPVFFLLLRLFLQKKLRLSIKWIAVYILIISAIAAIFHPMVIWHSLQHAMNHRLLSANASNMYWLVTVGYNYFVLGTEHINHIYVNQDALALIFKLPVIIVFVLLSIQFFKQPIAAAKQHIVFYMYIFYFAFFLFNIGIHENHAVPLAFVAWILSAYEPGFKIKATILLILAFLNQYLFYGFMGTKPSINQNVWSILTLGVTTAFLGIFFQSVVINLKRLFSPDLLTIKLPEQHNEVSLISSPGPGRSIV